MLKTLSILILFSINLIHSQMLKPENGSQLNYIHVLFEWEQINDAISYNFQLDNNNDFIVMMLIFKNEIVE